MTDGTERKRSTAASFGAHADAYLDSAIHRASDDLDRLGAWCGGARFGVDVATGAGHTAGAMVDAGVDRVIAADAAPAMVATATKAFPAVEGVVADAEGLPFADAAFDAAACRIAAHHFPAPAAFVAEVARVLEPGGVFAFEDNVAPDDPELDAFLNQVERLRDPTHVRSHTVEAWLEWLETAGFTIETTRVVERTLKYDDWVGKLDQPPENRDRLQRLFADPPQGAAATFQIATDDGTVSSFANHKLLVKAIR